ncbi:MAG: AAA family ATPase [Lentisphaeria bacterium]|nr:AAA family ATPase [Lentisphaeria bacterium]
MPNLDEITIRGLKSIRSLEKFELRNLNVIVGANGAGKSNFIELFRIISAMMKTGGLKEYVGGTADAYFWGGPKQTPEISVKLKFGNNGYDFQLIPTEDGFFMVKNEKRHFFPYGATRNFMGPSFDAQLPTELDSEATRYTYDAITNWQIYHFHDTGKLAGMRKFCDANHNEKLFSDAGNIAAFLMKLKDDHNAAYEKIRNAIQLVVPFFDDFILQPNKDENVRLSWRQKGLNDYPMRPSQLSDGSIRFICLATALLQPNPPSTIIIDEPELGLHPEAIGILAELIALAAKQTQVVIATQSPLLLDNFSIEDIIVAKRSQGATTLERLKEEDYNVWLEDYTAGELWTHDIIHGGTIHE